MRVVIDTNVMVSAVMSPNGPAARLVSDYVLGAAEDAQAHAPGPGSTPLRVVPLVDERILAEYRDVLARPRFNLAPTLVADFLAAFEAVAIFIDDAPASTIPMPDEDDRPFLDVALAEGALVIVSRNKKHFVQLDSIDVLTADELLRFIESGTQGLLECQDAASAEEGEAEAAGSASAAASPRAGLHAQPLCDRHRPGSAQPLAARPHGVVVGPRHLQKPKVAVADRKNRATFQGKASQHTL